jgi:hypothetical protein
MNLGVPRPLPCVVVPALVLWLSLSPPLVRHAAGADTDDDAAQLKNQADRWFDLEKRAADERNEWRTQKEVLTASIDVLKKEQASLQSKVEANELSAGLFAKRIETARTELAAHEAAHETLAAGCTTMERRLRALFPRLPEPLQQKIQPMLNKLERPPAPLNISERTQALVAALTAVDLFNNSLTLTHHLRKNAAGDALDVKVLYWGLAMGYGVDADGTHAWLLTPGDQGWQWQEAPEHSPAIRTLVGIYEKRDNPVLVTLPVGTEGTSTSSGQGGAQ